MDMEQIGARIRELREICGYTAEELAQKLFITEDKYISYEENGADIPISVLHRLATLYRVDMTDLVTGVSAHLDSLLVVREGQGDQIDRYPGYRFASLAQNFKHRIMEPLLVAVDPEDDDPALVTHGGQEFNFLLKGSLDLIYGDRRVRLNPGDCAYFDPRRPHGQKAIGQQAVFLTVIAEEANLC